MRIRDLGVRVGSLPTGRLNKITDVPGVRVGHATVDTARHKTGVTVVLPCPDNPFERKLTAACHVENGYGKTLGLVQLEELGQIETPIALTNTLNVGLIHDAMIGYMQTTSRFSSINPIVCECNDAYLNDIAERVCGLPQLLEAVKGAREDFQEGAVGAGTGMSAFGLKGGVGSASRVVEADGRAYALGVLALANFGRRDDLLVGGKPVPDALEAESVPDRGSCILIAATDLPLTDRQLKRVIRRGTVGLARTGSYLGHGSGDVFVGFTTKNRIGKEPVRALESLREDDLDIAFRAMAESTEEAVLNALAAAKATVGVDGHRREALCDLLRK